MSKYIIRTVHIVEVPDDAGFNAADIFDDPDYFINLFENFSYCDSVEEKEDKWDSPYMAFDNEHDAEVCAEKRCKRNKYDGKEWTGTFWDEYSFSGVVTISVLMDVAE